MSVGRKDDSGKPPVGRGGYMYFPRAMAALSLLSQYGKQKYHTEYHERNFLHVEDGVGRYTDAVFRHAGGEVTDDFGIDPETGYPHMYATAWNALARLECYLTDKATEDRRREEEYLIEKEFRAADGLDQKWQQEYPARVHSLAEQLSLDLEDERG